MILSPVSQTLVCSVLHGNNQWFLRDLCVWAELVCEFARPGAANPELWGISQGFSVQWPEPSLFFCLGLLHWALRAAVFSKLLIIIPWGICGAPAPPEGPRTGQRLGGAPGVPSARPWHSAGALGLLAHLGTPRLVTSCGLVQPLLPGFWHSLGWWWPRVGSCPGDVLFQMFWHWGQAERLRFPWILLPAQLLEGHRWLQCPGWARSRPSNLGLSV